MTETSHCIGLRFLGWGVVKLSGAPSMHMGQVKGEDSKAIPGIASLPGTNWFLFKLKGDTAVTRRCRELHGALHSVP